jgi:hypothetical protein
MFFPYCSGFQDVGRDLWGIATSWLGGRNVFSKSHIVKLNRLYFSKRQTSIV